MALYFIDDTPALEHYGVLGMKWGVRKDREKGSSSNQRNQKDKKEKRRLTDKQKRALKIGAIAVGSALAIYGIYRLNKATSAKWSPNYDLSSGLLKKGAQHSKDAKTDLLRVNKFRAYTGDPGTTNNCMHCSVAYDLRRRGYNVRAGRTPVGHPFSDIDKWYSNASHKKITPTMKTAEKYLNANAQERITAHAAHTKKIIETMESYGPNARGTVLLQWETGGGHSVAWETDARGKAQLVEAQIGKAGKDITMRELGNINLLTEVDVVRLDNAKINPKRMLEEGIVRNEREWHGTKGDVIATGAGAIGGAIAAKNFKQIKEGSKQTKEDSNDTR